MTFTYAPNDFERNLNMLPYKGTLTDGFLKLDVKILKDEYNLNPEVLTGRPVRILGHLRKAPMNKVYLFVQSVQDILFNYQ